MCRRTEKENGAVYGQTEGIHSVGRIQKMRKASGKGDLCRRGISYRPPDRIYRKNRIAQILKRGDERIKWNTSVSKALHWEIPAVLIITVKKSEVMKPMRAALSGSRDKGTALDAMTKIIARAALTLINFMNRIIKYRLKEKLKPDTEMFHKVLEDSRKVKKKEERER